MEREWKNVESNPPKESGRYWCYVQHLNDLGTSYFQWNCYFDKEENRWSVDKLNKKGFKPSITSKNRIRFNKKDSVDFLEWIKPKKGIMEQYKYKWNI